MARRQVNQYPVLGTGLLIKAGITSDELLALMPNTGMTQKPNVVGQDDDGYIVEWHYLDVIFTLAFARGFNMVTGDEVACYTVQKIEEIVDG